MARYCSWTATLLCIIMAMEAASAYNFKVGGNQGWAPPSGSEKETYKQWAERYRFLINDTLVFTYNPSVDSVLVVNKQDYDTCTTSNPNQSFKDGNSTFQFPKHGPFYFISGNATNCQKGEKLVIVVLSPRTPRGKSNVAPAPAPTVASPPPSSLPPSPSPSTVPSPLPSSLPPSPSPSTVASPPSAVPVASPSGFAPVASPTVVSPSVSPTVASVPSEAAVPAMGPANAAPQVLSPVPTPSGGSGGGVVPSASAGNGVHSWFVSVTLAILALAFSVAY